MGVTCGNRQDHPPRSAGAESPSLEGREHGASIKLQSTLGEQMARASPSAPHNRFQTHERKVGAIRQYPNVARSVLLGCRQCAAAVAPCARRLALATVLAELGKERLLSFRPPLRTLPLLARHPFAGQALNFTRRLTPGYADQAPAFTFICAFPVVWINAGRSHPPRGSGRLGRPRLVVIR